MAKLETERRRRTDFVGVGRLGARRDARVQRAVLRRRRIAQLVAGPAPLSVPGRHPTALRNGRRRFSGQKGTAPTSFRFSLAFPNSLVLSGS